MTTGALYILACILSGDTRELRGTRPDLFTDEELPMFDLLRRHVRTYGILPDKSVFTSKGITLPSEAKQPPSYYLDRLRHRKVFNQINDRIPDFRAAMRTRTVEDAVSVLREMLAGVTHLVSPLQFSELSELVMDVKADYEYAKENPGLRGITTGWPTADEMTLGLQGGDLIVVAGRTGMGKSWVILHMLYHAWLTRNPALFVSMEMSMLAIAYRFMGIHSRVNPQNIRAGELTTLSESHLFAKCDELVADSGTPIWFQTGNMQKETSTVRDMIQQFNPSVVYIDAAYLMTAEGARKGYITKWENISNVIRDLKGIAADHNIPIVVTVQLNRNVTKETSRNIDTSDISGSDVIPQDASIVLGIRQGPAPYESIRRTIDNTKTREGIEGSFDIHRKFSPVDFSEAPPIASGEMASEVADLGWMV